MVMIDKQAAIDAILSTTIFDSVEDLREYTSATAKENGWAGGILTAIEAIEDMDNMEEQNAAR